MTRQETARILLTALLLMQAAATAIIDANKTHAKNPLWPGHARFHVVWQIWNLLLFSLLACTLLWIPAPYPAARFYLALALAAIPCFGFALTQATRRLFGGTLSDPNGMPQLRVSLGPSRLCLDGNAVAVYAAFCVFAFLIWVYRS